MTNLWKPRAINPANRDPTSPIPGMTRQEYYKHLRRLNQETPCDVPECNRMRANMFRVCNHHLRRDRFYGDFNGNPLDEREVRQIEARVAALIAVNSSHPALLALERVCRNRLSDSEAEPPNRSGVCIWRYLYAHGISGQRLLERIVALHYIRMSEPSRFKTRREWHLTMCHAVLALAPKMYRRKSGPGGELRPLNRSGKREFKQRHRFAAAEWIDSHLGSSAVRIAIELDEVRLAAERWVKKAEERFLIPEDPYALLEAAGMATGPDSPRAMRVLKLTQQTATSK